MVQKSNLKSSNLVICVGRWGVLLQNPTQRVWWMQGCNRVGGAPQREG
jgi:hypothetical protein